MIMKQHNKRYIIPFIILYYNLYYIVIYNILLYNIYYIVIYCYNNTNIKKKKGLKSMTTVPILEHKRIRTILPKVNKRKEMKVKLELR